MPSRWRDAKRSPASCAISRRNTANSIPIAEIGLDGRVAGSLEALTYLNPQGAKVGQIVLAPLGTRTVLGVVLRTDQVTEVDLPVSLAKMRSVSAGIQGLDLPDRLVELATTIADEYLSPMSHAAALLLPPGVRDRLVSTWIRTDKPVDPSELTALQHEVLQTMADLGGELSATKSKPIAAAALRALKLLRGKHLVREVMSVQPKVERMTLPEQLTLTADEDRVEAFLLREGRKRPAQALTLMRLQGSEGTTFSPQEIKALSGVTDQTLRALLNAKLLISVEAESTPASSAPVLAEQQRHALDAICKSLAGGDPKEFLLFGVTGSGKTEVYLHAAAEALRRGKQVLYLVPEIALTAQVISQLRGRFGKSVVVIHSNLTPQERLENWLRIQRGDAPVVLGARSAIFAPLDNLGLIILDEEHEQSYKQESAPRYHAKTLARHLAKKHGATIVLGSATPSIETFWEANTGAVVRLDMPVRAASAQLPEVEIVDLGDPFRSRGKPSMFSPELRKELEGVLARKEQAILFLNRRAYSRHLSCRECGFLFQCPACAVALAYHKRENTLECHYCGHQRVVPTACDQCHSEMIAPVGAGSEKVEESLRAEFPEARVARLDRDIAKKKGVLEETFALMRAQEIDFLVGTQMVAKGLDFPGVTLVGVVVADTALHFPDFRASERTFQLLSQVAGRAGRGKKLGRVIIQTFSPKHPAVVFARDHDYLALYEEILEEREAVGYPPFNRLVNVLFTGADRSETIRKSAEAGKAVQEAFPEALILGPVDCSIERLHNQFRRHLIIKAGHGVSLKPIQTALAKLDFGRVQVTIDVDPYTMI